MEKNNSGITLLALVITIIVILILAGISIGMISGNNGTIDQATNAKMRATHAQVYEQLQMEEISCLKESALIIGYLQNKGIIGLEIEPGKGQYQVNVSSLLGNNQGIGTGTATETKKNNVYILEKQSEENANGEVVYKVVYYGKNQDERTDLGKISGEEENVMILKVNSGNSGEVELPILCTEDCDIDWGGEGEIINGSISTGNTEFKVASIKNGRYDVAGSSPSFPQGTGNKFIYNDKNKDFIVTVRGKVKQFGGFDFDRDKLIEIIQWGETGLQSIGISYCTNLVSIASPRLNSFQEMESFYGAFTYCTSLRSIPSNLFRNCPNVTDFTATFAGCTELQEIPENLFSNCSHANNFTATFAECTKVESIPENLFGNYENVIFIGTFSRCTSLKGNAPESFKNITNFLVYDLYQNGYGCFYDCGELANVPEGQQWKSEIPRVEDML